MIDVGHIDGRVNSIGISYLIMRWPAPRIRLAASLTALADDAALCPLSGAYSFLGTGMHRYAIFVDAGYLSSQAMQILAGKGTGKPERRYLKIPDPAKLLDELRARAEECLGNDSCLRTYWYDGMGSALTPEQAVIAALPDVQFRAGTIHNSKQKGVDSRIVHDLFELASNKAICDALVVTGDGDLAVGVEFAQRRGVRVGLMSVEDPDSGVLPNRHPELLYLADRQVSLNRKTVERLFRYQAEKTASATSNAAAVKKGVPAAAGAAKPETASPAVAALPEAVSNVLADLEGDALMSVLMTSGGVEPSIDRLLLAKARELLGRRLGDDERKEIRKMFIAEVKAKQSP
jgi:uncharacterized LabA/DUF88 family protein